MLSALIGIVVAGIVGLVVLTVALALIGTLFGLVFGIVGLAVALAVKVVPLLLVGYVIVKLVQRGERCGSRSRLSAADRAWLDS
jgi:hypothetical protein